MPDQNPVLHLVGGKIAAGKSPLAARLASTPAPVLISEARWFSRLYPGEINGLEDYVRRSGCLADAMGPHVETLLCAGLSVVMDFPANTPNQRQRLRGIFESAGVAHRLHFLDVPDAVCKARLGQRNEDGTHDYAASDAEFDLFTSYFVPPAPEEGFTVITYDES